MVPPMVLRRKYRIAAMKMLAPSSIIIAAVVVVVVGLVLVVGSGQPVVVMARTRKGSHIR